MGKPETAQAHASRRRSGRVAVQDQKRGAQTRGDIARAITKSSQGATGPTVQQWHGSGSRRQTEDGASPAIRSVSESATSRRQLPVRWAGTLPEAHRRSRACGGNGACLSGRMSHRRFAEMPQYAGMVRGQSGGASQYRRAECGRFRGRVRLLQITTIRRTRGPSELQAPSRTRTRRRPPILKPQPPLPVPNPCSIFTAFTNSTKAHARKKTRKGVVGQKGGAGTCKVDGIAGRQVGIHVRPAVARKPWGIKEMRAC